MDNLKVLILDDEERVREEIQEFLESKDFTIFSAGNKEDAIAHIQQEDIDIAILDIKLPKGVSGLDVLSEIRSKSPSTEVIMISGHGDMSSVIEAMRRGAIDYFQKPFRLLDISRSIEKTKRFIKLNKELKEVKGTVDLLSQRLFNNLGHKFLGNSIAMQRVREIMNKVAQVDTNVLITGESGTGKELVAHGIHYLSQRHKKTFHSVNCSAIPESLFESEFFGHKKGSFTGANEDKPGWFEIANDGTLFLDEIGDMPLVQQAKLLRTLENKKVSKVGSRKVLDVDVRVIAASNQELEQMSHENKFRLDLYFRLSTFVINIPPLRERYEDIPLLLSEFIKANSEKFGKTITGYDQEVVPHLQSYNFPGNVRELRNLVERAVILCDGEILRKSHFLLPSKNFEGNKFTPVNTQSPNYQPSNPVEEIAIPAPYSSPQKIITLNNEQGEELDLVKLEVDVIQKAMKKTNNNKAKAAKLLNITWQSLDRRIKKYEIHCD